MSDELSETNEIFYCLPVDVQSAFTERWNGTMGDVIARRGPIPDPDQAESVEILVKLFFIHGYMASQREAQEEMQKIERLVRAAKEAL